MPPPPAKPEAPPAAPPAAAAKQERPAPAPEPSASAAAQAAPAKGIKAWLPAIVALVVAPAATWATAQFVLVPQLQKKLALPPPNANGGAHAKAADDHDSSGKPKEASRYQFNSVVVNLAGTMGTRYLKTSFHVVGDPKAEADVKAVFTENHDRLYDTTINILSSLTLADLEEAGAKNVIREKLVSAYNQVLKKKVAEQIYFSEFVVQ